jgi:hypothetical protein
VKEGEDYLLTLIAFNASKSKSYDMIEKLIAENKRLTEALNAKQTITGETSDGYHTFNELYEHRHSLFANLVNQDINGWKSKKHSNGTMFDGWFIAGIKTSCGDITYHLPLKHWDLFQCKQLDVAPEWDGHISDDVIRRLQTKAINTRATPDIYSN